MMRRLTFASLLLSVLALNTHADVQEASATSLQSTKPTSTYYTARRDFRRCMFPMCGGYWVTEVNAKKTTCANGSKAAECYVAEMSLPNGVSLEDGDLFHGQISERTYANMDTAFGVMDTDAVYSPVLPNQPSRGEYDLVYDNGIRCFRAPCDSTTIARLNTAQSWNNRSFYFWGATAAEDQKLEEAFQPEFANGGGLVFGHFVRFWGIRYLEINNVYTTKAPVIAGPQPGELGGFCGGIAAIQCNDGLTCELDGNYPDAGGVCIEDRVCVGDEYLLYVANSPEMCQLVRYTCISQQGFGNDCGCGCCPESVVVDCEGLNAAACSASSTYLQTRADLDNYGCTGTELIGAL